MGRAKTWSRREAATAFLYLLPSMVFLAVFTLLPVASSGLLSLFRWNSSSPTPLWNGLHNYQLLLSDPTFWKVVGNTLTYAVGTLVPTVIGALGLAILVNQQLSGRGFFRAAVFYPTIIPMATAALTWVVIFTPGYGLLAYYLRALGGPNIQWLGDTHTALWSLIIVGIWKYLGYYMLIFLAGLQAIPRELYESASIEGAGAWSKFRSITLPLLAPTTFFVGVIAITNSFLAIDQVFVMTQGGPADATNVLVYYIYQYAFQYADFGYGATISTVMFVFLILVVAAYVAVLSRRVHYQ